MMEGELGKLLGGARRKRLGHGLELRLLSAREVLEARREAEGLSRDGAEQGTNLSVYRELAGIAGLRVTASGGISSLDELRELQRIGTHAAILGKALYTGRLDLKAVLEEVGVC